MKATIAFILCICSLEAVCKNKNVYLEYHIISLQYKKDTIKFNYPQVITLKELGCTPIINLGISTDNEYGVRLELLKSNIGLQDDIILAKCFFIKNGDSWKEIYKSASLQQNTIKVQPSDLSNKRDWNRGGETGQYGEANGFEFSYMEILYTY